MRSVNKPVLVYALQDPPKAYSQSIFLAGPTPRDGTLAKWRLEAIEYFKKTGYTGVIFIPEAPATGPFHGDNQAQIEREDKCLNLADCILFWIPRDLKNLAMPAFTTNIEWGRWEASGKVVFGAPQKAPKNSYIKYYANHKHIPASNSLEDTIDLSLQMVKNGQYRALGEREVPLHIWNTQSFQEWYKNLQKSGNRLDHARQILVHKKDYRDSLPFIWIMRVDVYVKTEGRNKSNELIISRPDISTVLLYRKKDPIMTSDVVLVREYRSPSSNAFGYLSELPGGSSDINDNDILNIAISEIKEETGLIINPDRLKYIASKQLVSTLSIHRAHLFSTEITDAEFNLLSNSKGHKGIKGDTEQTYIKLTTLGDALNDPTIDWSMMGMIVKALLPS